MNISKVRQRIKVAEIIDKLQEKFLTDQTLTSNEIGAARLLLDKALPNLQHQILEGSIEHRVQRIEFIVERDTPRVLEATADRDNEQPEAVQRLAGPSKDGKDSLGGVVVDPEGVKLPSS